MKNIEMDAEIDIYLNNILANQWNLAMEYAKDNRNEFKVKEYRAKIYNNKYKIAKKIDAMKKGFYCGL